MNRFLNIIGSRLALNIYLWVMLLLIKVGDLQGLPVGLGWQALAMMIYFMVLLGGFSYWNNLWLIPKMKATKRPLKFLNFSLLLMLTLAFIYALSLQFFAAQFPQLSMARLSLITFPVDPEFSWDKVFELTPNIGIGVVLWWIPFTLAGLFHSRNKEVRRMEQELLAHKNSELKFLKDQVNPHFLFNTLNNLYALSLKGSEMTSSYILKLSEVFRYILYDSNVPLVSFEKEREIMQSFIDIELLRLEADTDSYFEIAADQAYRIPPLLWLPVLENLFKHTRHQDRPKLYFRFVIHEQQLFMEVKNPGTELITTQNTENRSGGLGLSNLRKRLDLLYPDSYELTVEDGPQLYTLKLRIDLEA